LRCVVRGSVLRTGLPTPHSSGHRHPLCVAHECKSWYRIASDPKLPMLVRGDVKPDTNENEEETCGRASAGSGDPRTTHDLRASAGSGDPRTTGVDRSLYFDRTKNRQIRNPPPAQVNCRLIVTTPYYVADSWTELLNAAVFPQITFNVRRRYAPLNSFIGLPVRQRCPS
jgi:hypothetical protein